MDRVDDGRGYNVTRDKIINFPNAIFFLSTINKEYRFDSRQNEIQCFPFEYSNFPISKFDSLFITRAHVHFCHE